MPSTGTRWTSTLRTAFSHGNGRLHTNFMHSEQGGAVLAPCTQQCSSRPPTHGAPRSVTRRGTGCARCACPAMAPHARTACAAVRRRRTGCTRFGRLRPRLGAKWANLPQPTVSHNLTELTVRTQSKINGLTRMTQPSAAGELRGRTPVGVFRRNAVNRS